ncbi:MAG: trypsin-like peptidase domain-containing protein [Sandaracinaceae bacterium]|nr:trypsin-like peptidase domain-containing protein [Sandaracinaceae bacterium]
MQTATLRKLSVLFLACFLGGTAAVWGASARPSGASADPPQPAPVAPTPPAAPSATAAQAAAAAVNPAPVNTPAVADAVRLGEAISSIAERVSPAVVSIRTEAQVRQQAMPFGLGGMEGGDSQVQRGEGSGVLITADGAILTNNHVVHNATRLSVVMQDGRTFRGRVVGTDPATDLAVIRITGTNLPFARLADSSTARVGEWVVAIGCPFGLDYSVTAGVVSAIGRGGLGMNEIEDYVQTDASINPGNSGGPLVNLRGEVLGINTMIVGRGSGIGFAVPSSLARNVADQLLTGGVVRRSWLGVGFQELTAELASSFGAQARHGALISHVDDKGPAAAAPLLPGDIVTSVDGATVNEGRDLMRAVMTKPIGATVQLGVLRNGRAMTLAVRTAERPGEDGLVASAQPAAPVARRPVTGMGLRVTAMTPQIARQIGYGGLGRVVVAGVEDDSPAARAGIRTGDVIVEADRIPVARSEQVTSAFRDGNALLRFERGNGAFYAVVSRDEG